MSVSTVVNVSAKENCVNGGVGKTTGISVRPGQTLVIRVDPSDTWSMGPGPRTSNANGLGNPLGADFGKLRYGNFSFLYGTLVGSLDGGQTFFEVGTSITMTTTRWGDLTLYSWDSRNDDNTGALTVSIQLD